MSYNNNDKNCNCNFPQRADTRKIFLECGCSPQDAIFIIDDDRVEDDQLFVLDRVLVDTSCLNRAQVKVDFSSLIVFEAESENSGEHEVEVDLLFKLERACGGVVECIQSWSYLKEFDVEGDNIDELEIEISESFNVTFCDRPCPGCYEYRMIVEGIDFEGEFDALRVVKPNLSAIFQGL